MSTEANQPVRARVGWVAAVVTAVIQLAVPAAVQAAAVRPVDGPVVAAFDPPDIPYGPGHRGVDLGADAGERVVAALDGTIAFAGPVAGVGWVTVDHGGGLATTYGDVMAAVAEGQPVAAGQAVGHLADGAAHLDWGARLHGRYIDPLGLLGRWRAHRVDPDSVPRGGWVDV